jgi:hypothetical protein
MRNNIATTELDSVVGAPEFELTDEMVVAGSRLIAEDWGIIGADVAPDLARDVFNAMWAARPH